RPANMLPAAAKVSIDFMSIPPFKICLTHAYGDFVACAAEVGEAHGHRIAGRNAAGHSNIRLVQAGESRCIAKEQDLCCPPADGYLWCSRTAVHKPGEIDGQ